MGTIVTVGSYAIGWSLLAIASGSLLLFMGIMLLIKSWKRRRAMLATVATATISISSLLIGGGLVQLLSHSPGFEEDASIKRSTGDKPITLTGGYSVNLDSDEPNWEIKQGPGGDLYLWGGLNSGLGMATSGSVSYVEGKIDITRCKEATDLQPEVASQYLRTGTAFCLVGTSENRIAWVSIAGRKDDPYQIRIEVTVWNESA
ncbi:hypothetical protein ACN27F_06585 [Solwaraspora sp. WMMB335]|uniref:hypothetical protein n=1 Tax=Solwaraspora sp. WMMB335 TaxID=3404118 RepID=UPI003B94F5BE